MIRALIVGKLSNDPEQRTARNGKPFAICRASVPMAEGDYVSCSVICFDGQAVERLLQLREGAGVAMAGTLKVSTWATNNGTVKPKLDMVCDEVSATTPRPRAPKRSAASNQAHGGEFDDLPGCGNLEDWQ